MYICDWDERNVQDWLRKHDLEKYGATFLKNEVNGDDLTDMDELDLIILEINEDDYHAFLSLIFEAKKSLEQKHSDQNKFFPPKRRLNIIFPQFPEYEEPAGEFCQSERVITRSAPVYVDRTCHTSRPERFRTNKITHKGNSHPTKMSLTQNKSCSLFNKNLVINSWRMKNKCDIPPISNIEFNNSKKIKDWSEKDVGNFLRNNLMEKYYREFRKNAVDGQCLLDMSIKEFQMLGLTLEEAELVFLTLKTRGEV